jgi:hypothetical protein
VKIDQRMWMAVETAKHKVVFVLTHDDAASLEKLMEGMARQPTPLGPVYSWHFHGVPVQPADVRQSYIIYGWDQPTIEFI